jgi:hypothetical protein
MEHRTDQDIYVEETDPDVPTATKAMRVLEQAYGTNHYLTRHAYHELLRVQALDKTVEWEVPTFIAMHGLAYNQAKLEKKLSIQVEFLRQAKDQQEYNNKEIYMLEATMAKIQTQVRFMADQRHDLHTLRALKTPQPSEAGLPSSPVLTRTPILGQGHPDSTKGHNNTTKPDAGSSTRPPGKSDAGPQEQRAPSPPGPTLAAKKAKMVGTSVWVGRDATHSHPSSYASSLTSFGEHETQDTGVSRRTGGSTKPQHKTGPYHRQ